MKIFSFNSKSGTTLIELLVALLIIALVILGGGMFFFHGRVNIIREAHRRAALLVASQRLEALKGANYSDITPGGFGPNYDSYYIIWGSGWDPRESLTYEDVTVDNLANQKMLTEAQYIDDDDTDGIDNYDYLKVTVTVEWSDPATNTVSLTTLIAPH